MNKEKARPAVGAAERAAGTAAYARAATSPLNFSTAAVDRQLKISDLLCKGRENALPLRHLKTITGRDGRTIRLKIERERRNGTLILSDCRKGYFLAADEAEAQAFTRSMRKRAGEIIKTASAIERAAGID